MYSWLVLWLIVSSVLQVSVYTQLDNDDSKGDKGDDDDDDDDDDGQPRADLPDDEKGYLNIERGLFDYYMSGQFFSMSTDVDLLPWDVEDDFTNIRNHVFATAFLKLWTQLFAIEDMTIILKKGMELVYKGRVKSGEYQGAITELCGLLDQAVMLHPGLYAIYRQTKRDVIMIFQKTKFVTRTYMRKLSNNRQANLDKMSAFMNSSLVMRALNLNWMFYHYVLGLTDNTSRFNYIFGRSVIRVAKSGILQPQLQTMYDNSLFKVAKNYPYQPHGKDEDVQMARMVNALVHDFDTQIVHNSVLKKEMDDAAEAVKTGTDMHYFDYFMTTTTTTTTKKKNLLWR